MDDGVLRFIRVDLCLRPAPWLREAVGFGRMLTSRHRALLSAAAVCCLLGGCTQPAVSVKDAAFQPSENTLRDWNDVADRIAAGMAERGFLPTPGQPAPANLPAPVFVRVRAPDSAFALDVAAALETDIIDRGGVVARTPQGATVVNLDVDWVKWAPRDKPAGPVVTTAIFSVLTFGLFTDLLVAMAPTMNAEAICEATIMTDDRVVMQLRDQVYVRDRDIPLYDTQATLGPRASWESAAPLRVRQVRLDP